MIRRGAVAAIMALTMAGSSLRGQATSDRARLAVGVGIAYHGSGHLWTQDGQPIFNDTANVGRDIVSQLGLTFAGAYFPTEQWGIVGEVQFLGLHYTDSCRLLTSHNPDAQQVCQNLQGRDHDGTAATLTIGGIFRPWPAEAVSPYIRANAGLDVSLNSSIRMIGTWVTPTTEEADYYVYGDPNPREVTPTLSFGAGLTAPLGRSSQFRLEARDNVVFLERTAGTQGTSDPNLSPPTALRASHLFSLSLGFEVVLEKKRGRRY